MHTYDDLLRCVRIYQERYRHPALTRFELGEPYDLSPEHAQGSFACQLKWPDPWPHLSRAGIYAFFSEQNRLLYVGKASFGNSIAARLSSYCGYVAGKGTACRLHHSWNTTPRYVVTVAVPEDARFEAAALEEFLIHELQPPENSVGLRTR